MDRSNEARAFLGSFGDEYVPSSKKSNNSSAFLDTFGDTFSDTPHESNNSSGFWAQGFHDNFTFGGTPTCSNCDSFNVNFGQQDLSQDDTDWLQEQFTDSHTSDVEYTLRYKSSLELNDDDSEDEAEDVAEYDDEYAESEVSEDDAPVPIVPIIIVPIVGNKKPIQVKVANVRCNDEDLKERSFKEPFCDLALLKCGCKRECMRLVASNYDEILEMRHNFWGERHEPFTSAQRRQKLGAIALKAQTGTSLEFKFYLDTSFNTATEVTLLLV